MYNATEQFADLNKAGYDNAVKLAELSLEKAERLTKLNLQAAKVALEQGVFSANAVSRANTSPRRPSATQVAAKFRDSARRVHSTISATERVLFGSIPSANLSTSIIWEPLPPYHLTLRYPYRSSQNCFTSDSETWVSV